MNTADDRLTTIDDMLKGGDDRPSADHDEAASSPSMRDRIVQAATTLLAEGGREAASTRAVSSAAGVQPPTIYRQFGDMQGLLDAVASDGFARYVQTKIARGNVEDPVEDLRAGWDLHIGFGLTNPALYALMYGDPRPGLRSPAAIEAHHHLERLVQRVAESGRLRVGVDRATNMVQATGGGVVFTLIAMPEDRRDVALSAMAREAVIAAITTETPAPVAPGPVVAAVHLRAVLPQTSALTAQERALLQEWLDRIVALSP